MSNCVVLTVDQGARASTNENNTMFAESICISRLVNIMRSTKWQKSPSSLRSSSSSVAHNMLRHCYLITITILSKKKPLVSAQGMGNEGYQGYRQVLAHLDAETLSAVSNESGAGQ